MKNIFWSIYINIEREVLNLADMIHFTDNQLSVYSVRVSDLLIRCNVESESLIRELYKDKFKKVLDQPGQMLLALNHEWSLDKKRVSIISTNMHYSEKYASFCPFCYKNNGPDDYYKAYNSIKHDRSNTFEKYANIHFLLRALGALYILNIYFRKEEVKNIVGTFQIDRSLGSKIFAFNVVTFRPEFPVRNLTLSGPEELEAIYVIRPQSGYDEYFKEIEKVFNYYYQILKDFGYKPQIDENGNELEISYKELYRIAARLEKFDVLPKIQSQEPLKKYNDIRYCATLNTTDEIVFYKE